MSALPLTRRTPKPPVPHPDTVDYEGIEELDRPELDSIPPPPILPGLEWDEADGESGVKRVRPRQSSTG